MHISGQLSISVGQATSAGVKPQNEDSIGIRIPEGGLLLTKGAVAVIADGVSAAEAGKQASELCVQNFLSDYFSTPDSWTVKKSGHQVLNALNRWLYGQSQRYIDAQKGYASTLSAVVFKSCTAHIFHIGDSRVYRLRHGELEQLTNDHSMRVSETQAYLTRAMGLDMRIEIDYRSVDLEPGDTFLLTTDGVHDFVSSGDLKAALEVLSEELEGSCGNLINTALAKHSGDNLSCQILRIEGLPNETANDVYTKLTELPFPPPLSPGMILDGYRIDREIHASSRSQLYVVTDTFSQGHEKFVMKTPSLNYQDDAPYIERFSMESWIGSRIQNSHVVKVVEPDRRRSCLYYLLEYIDGLTLSQWMKEHPKAEVREVIYLLEQIVKGLRAFHRRETLHQDIKPDNILVDRHGIVKIIDFGSCLIGGMTEISVPIPQEVALGTETYSAPEYTLEKRPNQSCDIFSLAIVVYEMLAGQQPYAGKLAACKKEADFYKLKYLPSYRYNPLVPVWLDGALEKAMSISAADRYFDVSEFLHDIKQPNPGFEQFKNLPFLERNPLLFWQLATALLVVTQLVSLYFLTR